MSLYFQETWLRSFLYKQRNIFVMDFSLELDVQKWYFLTVFPYRCKSEFLTQMDGLLSHSNDWPILFIASTNLPWSLDSAILRRFQRTFTLTFPAAKTDWPFCRGHWGIQALVWNWNASAKRREAFLALTL